MNYPISHKLDAQNTDAPFGRTNTIIIETFVTTYMYFLLRKTNLNLIDKRYFNPKFVISATSNVFFKKREL